MSLVVLTPKIIVWGRTLAEHNERLNKVFLKIPKSELKLNKKKCQIGVKSIVFLGHISEDIKVDPAKIETVTKMPSLNSVYELQRFLGIIAKSCLSDLSLSYPAKERSLQNSS